MTKEVERMRTRTCFFLLEIIFQESSKSTTSSSGLKAVATFDEINKRAKSQPELVKKVGAIIVFDITKDGKVQQSWSKSIEQ